MAPTMSSGPPDSGGPANRQPVRSPTPSALTRAG